MTDFTINKIQGKESMKPKSILTAALLAFVGVSVVVMLAREPGQSDSGAQAQNLELGQPGDPNEQLVVYYFHRTKRCDTCQRLEEYTKQVLDNWFADQQQSRQIVWHRANIESPDNSHFREQYELTANAVVLSKTEAGQEVEYENLDQIWNKVGNQSEFFQYIRQNIESLLD